MLIKFVILLIITIWSQLFQFTLHLLSQLQSFLLTTLFILLSSLIQVVNLLILFASRLPTY